MTDILDRLEDDETPMNDSLAAQAANEIRRLRLLCIRKSEALAIVASPSMWERRWTDDIRSGKTFVWNGAAEFADPIAFAKRESEATDANS